MDVSFKLSPKSQQRLFNRKLGREGFVAIINRYSDKNEVMICAKDRCNATVGLFTVRYERSSSMGKLDMPCVQIRSSKLIRDTERQLRQWTDAMERKDRIDASREAELSGEMREKFKSMCNRHNFFPQSGDQKAW